MNNTIKTIGGIVVGASLAIGASSLLAQQVENAEVIEVTDNGEQIEKVSVTVKQSETKEITKFSGNIEQLNKIISGYDKVIAQFQARINEAQAKKDEYVALREKIQAELDNLPKREEPVAKPVEADVFDIQ